MNKIKYDLLKTIIYDTKLTNDEINMLIYLAKVCDELGTVEGVYYQEYCNDYNISYSQFYKLLKNLENKGYICVEKMYKEDLDITLLNNSFIEPGEDYEPVAVYKDYLNLNMKIFEKKSGFFELKSNAKKMLLHILVQGINNAARANKNRKFDEGKAYAKIFRVSGRIYNTYANILNVSKRMIKMYFEDIKKWLSFFSNKDISRDILTVKEEEIKKPDIQVTEHKEIILKKKTDRFDSDLLFIKKHCRRYKIEVDGQALCDTAMLVSQYQNKTKQVKHDIRMEIIEAITKCCVNLLSPPSVNRFLSNKFSCILKEKNYVVD